MVLWVDQAESASVIVNVPFVEVSKPTEESAEHSVYVQFEDPPNETTSLLASPYTSIDPAPSSWKAKSIAWTVLATTSWTVILGIVVWYYSDVIQAFFNAL